jgi:alpha,alpha-trehalose phosphorylase
MIDHPEFGGDEWTVVETGLNLDHLAQTESVFALANGHIGLRGNLDEGEPHGLPGTYLGSFYELRPLTAPELIYGDPTTSQSVVNVTNGKIIRLLVDDEPFDIRYGELRHHQRILDMRAGTLSRTVEWVSPGHRTVRVRSTRLVSLTQRAVVAIRWEVEAVGDDIQLVIQSELVANEELPAGQDDPRRGQPIDHALESEAASETRDGRMLLMHRTRTSGLRVAAMVDHQVIEAPDDRELRRSVHDDLARAHVITTCPAGGKVAFIKYVAYGWSRVRSSSALEDQVAGALFMARHTGFDGLVAGQRRYLDDFWDRADVQVEGDPKVQQAVRFSLWQVLQAGARTEKRAIPAKGLTGPGYDGHAFWDTEMYVLPVLTYTQPQAAADALAWRHYSLPAAIERARQLGLKGAAFPWRTIHGEECSGYWPASTAAFHINADVAEAVVQYLWASGDEEFGRRFGVELLVATARMWMSLGHDDPGSGFRIDGVTGPDEYSAVADNNIYTNLMAQRNLRSAANAADHFPDRGKQLGVDQAECDRWRRAADNMVIPYDADLGVHAQAEGFTRHARWDFDAMTEDDYPLLLHFPYFDLYRKQVVKQPDLVFALLVRGDAFTPEEKARNFAYYEELTVRDSSLAASIQSIVAAEVGHLDLAYDYLGEAALLDLNDLEHNTRDGLHIASLAGTWLALVYGFGGLRNHGEPAHGAGLLTFAPRLPKALTRLAFRLAYLGRRISVEVTPAEATYTLRTGEPVEVEHHGIRVALHPGQPETRPIPAISPGPAPSQPRGRAPAHRGPADQGAPIAASG